MLLAENAPSAQDIGMFFIISAAMLASMASIVGIAVGIKKLLTRDMKSEPATRDDFHLISDRMNTLALEVALLKKEFQNGIKDRMKNVENRLDRMQEHGCPSQKHPLSDE